MKNILKLAMLVTSGRKTKLALLALQAAYISYKLIQSKKNPKENQKA